jgi:hypothetical protein
MMKMKTLKEHIVYEDFEVVIRFDGRDKILVGPSRHCTSEEWYLPNTFEHLINTFIPWLVERGVKRVQLRWVLFKIHDTCNLLHDSCDRTPKEWGLTEEDIEKWLPKQEEES